MGKSERVLRRWRAPWAWVLVLACSPAGPPARGGPGPALETRRGDFEEHVLLTGELDAVRADKLVVPRTPTWRVTIRWMAEDGAAVKAGDKVLEFDSTSFTATLEEKRLAVSQARRDIDKQVAQNAVVTADKRFEVAKRQIEVEKARVQASVPEESFPRRVHQERQLELRRAEVELARARDELAAHERGAGLELDLRRIALEKSEREVKQAEEALRSLTLRAPRDGILMVGDHWWEGRKLQVGDAPWVGMPVVKLPDLGAMQVRAWLSDVDEGRVRVGMPVACTLDAYPDEPLPGKISQILPIAREPARESLRRAFGVTVDLARTDPARLRPGMSVRVDVQAARRTGVLLASRAAIDVSGGKPRARLPGGLVDVELGGCNGEVCVIERGLTEGMRLEGAR